MIFFFDLSLFLDMANIMPICRFLYLDRIQSLSRGSRIGEGIGEGVDWPIAYREATGYVESYNASEASWRFGSVVCRSVFRAATARVLLCRPLLVLVSVRFIRESALVCEGVIFFTLSEQPPLHPDPLRRSPLARVTDRGGEGEEEGVSPLAPCPRNGSTKASHSYAWLRWVLIYYSQ